MGDRRVPIYLKAVVWGAIIYLISPFDIIPDYLIPFFGYIEDIFILYFSMKILVKYSPKEVVREYVQLIDKRRNRR